MRILLVNPLDYRYGTTYRARMFAESFKRLGLDVDYVEANSSDNSENAISVKQGDNIIGYFSGSLRRSLLCFFRKYDILFIENFTPLSLSSLIAAKLRMKTIIVDWDAFEFIFQKTFLRKILTFLTELICPYCVDYIISPSQHLIDSVKKRGIHKISQVPHFINTSLFRPEESSRVKIREKMSWEGKRVICYLCAFNPGGIRDLRIILEAMKLVISRIQDACLLLIGEGSCENEVIKLLDQHAIKNYHILGIKQQNLVAEYINAADMGIIYLQNDLGSAMRTSIKLLVYLSMNKPVIGYITGESRDALGRFIVSCEANPESLAERIIEAANSGCVFEGARDYIVKNYSFEAAPDFLREILKKAGKKCA